ncbi:Tyrosine recombinase XerC [subsurface metagenome]
MHLPETAVSGTPLPTPILQPAQLAALLRAPDRRTPTGARQLALLHLLAGAGTRLGETLAIAPADVALEYWELDGHFLELTVLRLRPSSTKGARPRIALPLAPETAAALRMWTAWRPQLAIAPNAPLFCTVRSTATSRAGRQLNPRQVRAEIARLAAAAGIRRHVHPHLLRHTALTSLYDRTRDLRLVQEVAGHASSRTTERYTHVHPVAIAVAMGALPITDELPDQLPLPL